MAFLETLKTTGEALAGVVVFIGSCWKGFGKKWWERYRKSLHARWDHLKEEMSAQNTQIASIKHMLYPNGGSSVFDMQTKVVAQVGDIIKKLNSLQVNTRNMWDILEIAAWESDENGQITWVSIPFCELVGATPSEMMGNSWVGRIAYWDRDKVVKTWKESISNGFEFNLIHSLRKSDGLYQMVQPIVIHNKDNSGKVLNSLGRLIKVGDPYKHE